MVKSLPSHLIIATDECAFYLNEAPKRGYNWKGARTNWHRTGNHTTRYTLMLCIRNIENKGVISYKLIERGKKEKGKKNKKEENKKGSGAVELHDFVLDVKSKLTTDEKYYLLLDNAKIHHATKVLQKENRLPIADLFNQVNIKPLYLVPYTPQLNPVELCFNFLSDLVERNQPRTYE